LRILGLSAFYHDSAAALIEDGIVVNAAQEERFTRKNTTNRFPKTQSSFAWMTPASHSPTSTTSLFTTSRS